MSQREKKTSTSAKLLYRPVGMVSSVVSGVIAGKAFDMIWKRASSGEDSAPDALETGYSFKEILLATALQGALFAVVHTLVKRGGANLFERWTGEWPGE